MNNVSSVEYAYAENIRRRTRGRSIKLDRDRIMKDTRCLKYYLWWGKARSKSMTKFACPTLTVTCINNNKRKKHNPHINISTHS